MQKKMHNFITYFDDQLNLKLSEDKNNQIKNTISCQNRPELNVTSAIEHELLDDCKLKVKEQAHIYYENKIKMLLEIEG